MNSISFFTPAKYGPFANTFGEFLAQTVDDYFFLEGKKAQVIPGHKIGNSEGVGYVYEKSPFLRTAIKVATYITLVIPLIALVAKAVLRTIYHYHLIPTHVGFVGNRPVDNIPPPPPPPHNSNNSPPPPPSRITLWETENSMSFPSIDFDTTYCLTCNEVITLKLRPTMRMAVSHDGTTESFPGPAYSDLESYKDSYFEVELVSSERTGVEFLITRKDNRDRSTPHLPLYTAVPLSPDLLKDLKINESTIQYIEPGVYGESTLPRYKTSKLFWSDGSFPGFPNGLIIRY